jgi:hypothetical protein
VATTSRRCAGSVAQFCGSIGTLLGSDAPNNGADPATNDFIGPSASKGTPVATPPSAVSVYRHALASASDGSVVMASIGYFGNLSALLNAPPDGISPMSGRELVAPQIRMLVAMAGRFPSGAPENNLIGDPAAAQAVAQNWPTKIVSSGSNVGINLTTGSTLTRVHPGTSPVRAADEALLGGSDKSYCSLDLTAVYQAIRPSDPALTEVRPGTNAFATGAGDQYYLRLNNRAGLQGSLESLLDTLPWVSDTAHRRSCARHRSSWRTEGYGPGGGGEIRSRPLGIVESPTRH